MVVDHGLTESSESETSESKMLDEGEPLRFSLQPWPRVELPCWEEQRREHSGRKAGQLLAPADLPQHMEAVSVVATHYLLITSPPVGRERIAWYSVTAVTLPPVPLPSPPPWMEMLVISPTEPGFHCNSK